MTQAESKNLNRLDIIGILFLLAVGTAFYVGISKISSNAEDVLQWLPDQSQAREDYDMFESQFGADDFLIVTWQDCTVDDPRLIEVTDFVRQNDSDKLIQSIGHGQEVIQRLVEESKLSPKTIVNRFRGIFFGLEDPKLTSLFIELSRAGTERRRDSIDLIWEGIDENANLERSDIRMGGYPFIATFIDDQLNQSYHRFLIPSVVMATIVALFCLRNLVLTMIVFITAVGAAGLSVAFIPLCGLEYGGLMSIIPALVFVLATSGSIHLIRYSLGVIGDVGKLFSIGWKPCTISAVTTAIGMLSLVRSDFPAIRNFGLFCATGVGFALVFQLVMVPWLLLRFGKRGLERLADRSERSSFWVNLIDFIRNHRIGVASVCGILMVLGAIGLGRLSAEVEVEKLFDPQSEIMVSLRGLEKRLGPMDQTELLVSFKNVDAEQFPDRVKLIRRIQAQVGKVAQLKVAYSLANALPAEPRRTNLRNLLKRATYRTQLRKHRDRMKESNLLFVSGDSETWRISLRFPFTEDVDFATVKDQVVEVATKTVDSFTFESPDDLPPSLTNTGKTHLFLHAQTTLLEDLFQNFLLAFLIITPILVVVLRSLTIGLVAMIPNVFPTLMVFGGLGWFSYPVDLAISMTACVALGIAVDDTTHFLIRFRDFGGSLRSVVDPIKETIQQCGPAMLHTTLIGGAGLFAYYFSQMLVISRFSWAITTLLLIALVADVVMLPAILLLIARDKPAIDDEVNQS